MQRKVGLRTPGLLTIQLTIIWHHILSLLVAAAVAIVVAAGPVAF
jgi:hypothetical protein